MLRTKQTLSASKFEVDSQNPVEGLGSGNAQSIHFENGITFSNGTAGLGGEMLTNSTITFGETSLSLEATGEILLGIKDLVMHIQIATLRAR
jgi:hypothetical protein